MTSGGVLTNVSAQRPGNPTWYGDQTPLMCHRHALDMGIWHESKERAVLIVNHSKMKCFLLCSIPEMICNITKNMYV